MIKQLIITIMASVISIGAFAQDSLLTEYNKEVEPPYKIIKGNKMLLQPLVDKQLRGELITKKDLDRGLFIECSSLINLNKINKISNKPKYKNLEKAQRMQKLIPKLKENMSATKEKCDKEGLYVPD
jgi:hypothetical protein